ncbi:histidine kinase [Bacillus sp. MUM 116]|uniref:histidine kinase n=1 Tax=Bacillus sp. MUM 116 TaxID=1678002 RepID=UPI0009F6A4DF
MVENLADILRYSLDGENKMVHLKEEITYTNSYIKIQKMCFQNKFEVTGSGPFRYECDRPAPSSPLCP